MSLVGKNLSLESISVDGKTLADSKFKATPAELIINDPPKRFILKTIVQIYPQKNTELSGLYKSGNLYCTQCEAEGFRAITYFLDRPDVLTTYTVTIHADKTKCPVLLSNGNLVAKGDSPDGRHWVKWVDPFKKPCYLFALVAGDLKHISDSFQTQSGRKVSLELYSEAENVSKCDFAMQSLKNAMAWDEKVYGREYDLDIYMIVAVNDFNAGAMENKGLNIFNTKYILARPDTAVDQNYADIESVVGHEYFHNWSGNRVTCRDWFQLSLKEGFTVFRDQQFSADMGSAGVGRIDDVDMLRNHQFAEDDGPLAHPVRPDSYMEINNFYTTTIYNKGAEVIRMLHTLLGPETFRKACDEYFARYDGQAVTCDDFVAVMSEVSGVDLTQFKLWYSLAGTPHVKVESYYDEKTKNLKVKLYQTNPDTPGQTKKPPMYIPLAVGLVYPDSNSPYMFESGKTTEVLSFTQREQEFNFPDLKGKPVLSLLRSFSAPIKVDYSYSNSELASLVRYDTDPFSRWEAAQILYRRSIKELCADLKSKRPLTTEADLLSSFSSTVSQDNNDPELLSRLLRVPSQAYLLDQLDVYDVEGVYQAHQHLRRTLAEHNQKTMMAQYEKLKTNRPYEYETAAVGARALKNCYLSYLATLGKTYANVVEEQFQKANNMTDKLAALEALVNNRSKRKSEFLEAFFEQWKQEPLVVDKWFALQAAADSPTVLSEIKGLVTHPAFKLTNPNNVYSLIGTFFRANPYYFHAADGSGYQFLADQVIELDAKNPQVGARMVTGLLRWKKLDDFRQDLARAQLERILAVKNLSKNVYELAYKSLQS